MIVWAIFATLDPKERAYPIGTQIVGLAVNFYFGVIVAIPYGAAPAIAVMFLTRARCHPWRALPALAAGATVGLLLCCAVIALTKQRILYPDLMAMTVVGSLGGLASTSFLNRDCP